MTVTLHRPVLRGDVSAIPSKSEVHRLLIAAALADRETRILCMGTNDDIERTASSLSALGAGVSRDGDVFTVTPISAPFLEASPLPCSRGGGARRKNKLFYARTASFAPDVSAPRGAGTARRASFAER